MPSTGGRRDLIGSLQQRIREVLDPLLAKHTSFALVGFPNHSNVGDSALWLGQMAYLHARGGRVVYMCDEWSYDPVELARHVGDGAILISGGGSLGDIWPDYQRLREDVIARFSRHTILQLPQSMHFREEANLERARRAFDVHPDLTLLLRDESSLARARDAFNCASTLCPDMAFALGPLPRPTSARSEMVALLRSDAESAGAIRLFGGTEFKRVDWPAQSRTSSLMRGTSKKVGALVGRFQPFSRPLMRPLYGMYERLAKERLTAGCSLLGGSRVVVTDRLHGHILCLLLGIPHVCLDNVYGKVGGFVEAWTENSELVRIAGSPSEAADIARELASRTG